MVDFSVVGVAIVTGLATAMLLFLAAIGLSLIFGVLDVLNFAHGSLYMLGAYGTFFAYSMDVAYNPFFGRFWLSILIAVLLVSAIGFLMEVTVIRPIYEADHIMQLLLTFALILIIDNGVRIIWGTGFRSVPTPEPLTFSVSIFGRTMPVYSLFLIAVGSLVAIGIWAMFRFTDIGKTIRAAAEDRETAGAIGINVPAVFTIVFLFGSGLAALGGALAAPYRSIHPAMGESIIIDVFIVVVIGGLGSFTGTLVAAILIGVGSSLLYLINPAFQTLTPFILMILILMIKPEGLFPEGGIK